VKDFVILFGAGASHGAGATAPEQPPLGARLFGELERSYPGSWGRLPASIRSAFANDFESGMQLVHDALPFAIPTLMREMAVYFVQFRPVGKATLYCRLIRDLTTRGLIGTTLFSSLNYECVLEYSLLEGGHAITYFDEGDSGAIPVWKLHGSCNMFALGVQASPEVGYGVGVIWEGGLQAFLDANLVIQHCLVETGLAPAMSLYMRGKPLAISPSVILELQARWATAVETAKAVFCVGVRPVIEDDHIWGPLERTAATLNFIGDESSLRAWQTARSGATKFLGHRFGDAYDHILTEISTYAA